MTESTPDSDLGCKRGTVQPVPLRSASAGILLNATCSPSSLLLLTLSDENLEGTPLVAANRFPRMPAVDGKCDRSMLRPAEPRLAASPLLSRAWRRHAGSAGGSSPPRGCHRAGRTHRGSERARRYGQHAAHLGDGAFIVRRAAVGHDLRDWGEGPARRHATSAGAETGGTNLHRRHTRIVQSPTPKVSLRRTLRATIVTATPTPAMLLCLCPDQVALATRPGTFSLPPPSTPTFPASIRPSWTRRR